jgi:uncharacterized protein (TIGR00369 family)
MSHTERLLQLLREVYEQLPFNRYLGLKVTFMGPDGSGCDFPMKDELIGNYVHGILHGGVISSVLDATGGLTASVSTMDRMVGLSPAEIKTNIARVGTIDMRVDFLRPGRGAHFYATGSVMRTGRKVAVTRMELRDQDKVLIAVGTAAYIL